MTIQNINVFHGLTSQRLWRPAATMLFALGLLAGCADSLDATNDEFKNKGSSDGMTHMAMRLEESGDKAGAVDMYQRALQRKPNDIRALQGISGLLESGGYNTQAADYYQRLVKLEPDNIDNLRNYGRVLIKAGRPVDARQQYEDALAIDSNDVRSLNGLGVALDLIGNHPAAQDKYRMALGHEPGDLSTLSNLGHSYVLSERYEETIKILEPQAQNMQAPPALRQNLAVAYAAVGMNVDAERVLRKDMPVDQAKKFLASHRHNRDPLSGNCLPERPGMAELGSFGTRDLADAHASKVRVQFPVETQGLSFEVVPEIAEEGGTPDFHVRARGFKNAAAAKGFCEELKKSAAFCKAQ